MKGKAPKPWFLRAEPQSSPSRPHLQLYTTTHSSLQLFFFHQPVCCLVFIRIRQNLHSLGEEASTCPDRLMDVGLSILTGGATPQQGSPDCEVGKQASLALLLWYDVT